MIKCKMKISNIFYPKNKTIKNGDYCIFASEIIKHIDGEIPKVDNIYKTVTLKGCVPAISIGDVFTITFNNPNTNNYGTSYNVLSVTKEVNPKNKQEVADYLNLICGEKIATELMRLKNPYDLIINRNSEELLKVKGIKESRLNQIYKNIDHYSDYSSAIITLEPLGLTKEQIIKICKEVGGSIPAIDICKNRPYELKKLVGGIGFKKADEIAIKCGMNPFSKTRIKYAIINSLEESGNNGRSYLYANQLFQEMRKILSIEFNMLSSVVNEMLLNDELILSEDGTMIAIPYYVELEKKIGKEIERIRDCKSNIKIPKDWFKIVKEIEQKQGWSHTDEQLKGIEMGMNNNLLVISGKAGSGKSTITNAMTQILKNYSVSLCCLSAKASQRLREITGMDTSTIHKLIAPSLVDKNEKVEIYSDIVIVDESSMISGTLFLKLLRAIRGGSKVILLGDSGQLTAIGDCSVFSDLIASKKVPHIELTKIHRQAKKSAIITKSIDFRNQVAICEKGFSGHRIMGELQDLELFVLEKNLLLEQIKEKFQEDLSKTKNILEVQIISALKNRGVLSTQNINEEIQTLVSTNVGECFEGYKKTKIFIGDKVINLKNNYKAKNKNGDVVGVWNGSIGIVKSICDECVIVDFVGVGEIVINKNCYNNINLAYAISCHSSQGSQWKRVICGFDMSSYVLLNVELIYTALTRATDHCSLIIERKALDYSSRTVEQNTKQTLLPHYISNPR